MSPMKLPRDVSGPQLVKTLSPLGYKTTRQTGSHIRVTTHHPIKVGTLASILKRITAHHGMSVDDLLQRLDL